MKEIKQDRSAVIVTIIYFENATRAKTIDREFSDIDVAMREAKKWLHKGEVVILEKTYHVYRVAIEAHLSWMLVEDVSGGWENDEIPF